MLHCEESERPQAASLKAQWGPAFPCVGWSQEQCWKRGPGEVQRGGTPGVGRARAHPEECVGRRREWGRRGIKERWKSRGGSLGLNSNLKGIPRKKDLLHFTNSLLMWLSYSKRGSFQVTNWTGTPLQTPHCRWKTGNFPRKAAFYSGGTHRVLLQQTPAELNWAKFADL